MEPSPNQFKKYEVRGSHESLHLNLEGKVNPLEFTEYLSLQQKKEVASKSKSIWVHLNQDNLHLCGHLVAIGFKIHNGLDNKIDMYKWLEVAEDLVPPYSMFYIGCGGAVIDQNDLLLVQEKNGPRKDQWGLPGGLLNRGETIREGVERQVWEETGLKTNYQYIIYFRELDQYIHNSVDMYFVSFLRLSEGISRESLKLCDREILNSAWVPLSNLQQFMSLNKFNGTQKAVMPILVQLHKKGFKFNESMPNTTLEKMVQSRGCIKKFVEHRIIHV